MFTNIKSITALFVAIAFFSTGCKHYAAFPELEGEGVLSADNQNVTYDKTVREENKKIIQGKQQKKVTSEDKKENIGKIAEEKKVTPRVETISTATKPTEEKKPAEKTATKDLTIPDPSVEGIPDNSVEYVVPNKATPLVINDMDLKEMDLSDGKTVIIKPVTETKTILSTKEEIKVIVPEKKNKQPAAPTAQNTEASVFYLAETLYFGDGSAVVDKQYTKKLKEIVKEAKKHNGKIVVQGFASSRTKNTDIITHKMTNLKVSVARAENVAKLLAQYGMPNSQIITEGLSDSRPVYKEVMPEGERLNRRAEIYISY